MGTFSRIFLASLAATAYAMKHGSSAGRLLKTIPRTQLVRNAILKNDSKQFRLRWQALSFNKIHATFRRLFPDIEERQALEKAFEYKKITDQTRKLVASQLSSEALVKLLSGE